MVKQPNEGLTWAVDGRYAFRMTALLEYLGLSLQQDISQKWEPWFPILKTCWLFLGLINKRKEPYPK